MLTGNLLCTMYCALLLESGKVLYASTGNFELHVCFNQVLGLVTFFTDFKRMT